MWVPERGGFQQYGWQVATNHWQARLSATGVSVSTLKGHPGGTQSVCHSPTSSAHSPSLGPSTSSSHLSPACSPTVGQVMCVNMQKIESEELFPSDAEMEKLSDRYTELMNGKMRQLLTPGKKSIVFKKKKEITTWFSVTRVDAEY